MRDLREIEENELLEFVLQKDEKPFRARQILEWIWKKSEFDFKTTKYYIIAQQDTNTSIILGNDFLTTIGIKSNRGDQTITWLNNSVLYKPRDYFNQKVQICTGFLDSLAPDEGVNGIEDLEANVSQILETNKIKLI